MILLMFSSGFQWILGGAVAGGIVYTVIMVVRYRNSPTWPALTERSRA
jgi:hypothetical protein